jgi:hypothetical protein
MNTKETSRPQAGCCAWGILFNFEAGGDIKSRQNFNVYPKIKPEGHHMKELLALIVGLVMMSSLAVAQIDPDPNGIGVYFDMGATQTELALDTIFFSLEVNSCF